MELLGCIGLENVHLHTARFKSALTVVSSPSVFGYPATTHSWGSGLGRQSFNHQGGNFREEGVLAPCTNALLRVSSS
jgi:hypothetical protein